MRFFFILLLFNFVNVIQAINYSGIVRNQKNDEVVIGCVVYLKGTPSISTSTNIKGFYTIDVGNREDTLVFVSMAFASR